MTIERAIQRHLTFLYGEDISRSLFHELQSRLERFKVRNPTLGRTQISPGGHLTEKDAVLITYGDQIQQPGIPHLQTLGDFLGKYLLDTVSGVHLLPFFPYSSDDGFSVIDYRNVNDQFGSWDNIARIGRNFRLMVDGVINHISRQSACFQAFLRGEPPYTDYFIEVDPEADLSAVVRPRPGSPITSFETAAGAKHLWTTFSDDQIDLNYANPHLLLEMIDILLFYVERGAEIIRLDAIAYLWKKVGTPCIHLPQTHRVVKLLRCVLESVAPGVLLITETNVPHTENISYWGENVTGKDEYDEAHMVYQFALAPLVLHAFQTGNARVLTKWVATLSTPSPSTTFFNFIASHDGIGVTPAGGLLSEEEIASLVMRTLAHGGKVSYKRNPDGSKSAYELNITLFDALNNPSEPQVDVDIRRFMTAQVILLSLAGIPGIYVHSLVGSHNFHEGVDETGRARSINREKFHRATLEKELSNPDSHKHKVFSSYLHLLRERRKHPAFHPNGDQRVLTLHDSVFALVRIAPGREETVLCLANVSAKTLDIRLTPGEWELPSERVWTDLIGGTRHMTQDKLLSISVAPYQALWLHVFP